MQSLKLLGVEVVGSMYDPTKPDHLVEKHIELNPKGYFEHPVIYYNGPSASEFRDLLEPGANIAVKIDLRNLVDPAKFEYWREYSASIRSVIISYRQPAEQAKSEIVSYSAEISGNRRGEFIATTSFLRDYKSFYGQIESLLNNELQPLKSCTCFVDYRSIADPGKYIETLCRAAGIEPVAERFEAAKDNISDALYRVRQDRISNEMDWAVQLGAQSVYHRLNQMAKPID